MSPTLIATALRYSMIDFKQNAAKLNDRQTLGVLKIRKMRS